LRYPETNSHDQKLYPDGLAESPQE